MPVEYTSVLYLRVMVAGSQGREVNGYFAEVRARLHVCVRGFDVLRWKYTINDWAKSAAVDPVPRLRADRAGDRYFLRHALGTQGGARECEPLQHQTSQ